MIIVYYYYIFMIPTYAIDSNQGIVKECKKKKCIIITVVVKIQNTEKERLLRESSPILEYHQNVDSQMGTASRLNFIEENEK